MARIELVPETLDDFDRILDHLQRHEVADRPARIAGMIAAIQVLGHSPLIGRLVRGGKRELLIGFGSRGYIALYRYVPAVDTVFGLALRSQRERGNKRGL